MNEPNPSNYSDLLKSYIDWLTASEKNLVKHLKAPKASIEAWWELDTELVGEQWDKLKLQLGQDLTLFFTQYADEAKRSTFIQTIQETLWEEVAAAADKTQVAWKELESELAHHGVYYAGNIVGMGTFECENCHHQLHIKHPTALGECSACGSRHYIRLTLSDD